MTHLRNDPTEFKEDVITGFAAAYARYAKRVPEASGFVRAGGTRAGKVAVVVGGGSGHFPSYAGIVGRGLADACVMGDVFTSPSSQQVYRVACAADGGAGVILAFGNYAGDRLNFAAAAERLAAIGIDARIVYVTDDVASAAAHERELRRGIAGTLVVYKTGGASADAGWSIDDVERVMRRANDRTSTFGVAFAGCTLPGQERPLFSVAPGTMELGLGIHGEPGIRTADLMSADELAGELVETVLAERPDGADRAAVVVNGLGATKYEELLVLYAGVSRRLAELGVEPVLPEVGEFVTSLDMAGCSLTVTWLDDELEALWCAPVDTASFRRGALADPAEDVNGSDAAETKADSVPSGAVVAGPASDESIAQAQTAREALRAMRDAMVANEQWLGDLDAVAGDGDHGLGMSRGSRAACAAADGARGGVGTVLLAAGDAFGDRAGGTSGILWGILLATIGESLGDTEPVTARRLADAVAAASATLRRVGKAELGDKTMLDALVPFVDTLDARVRAGDPLGGAWQEAAEVAAAAAESTASLRANLGRARPLGDRSVGTPDPGATSLGLCVTAVGGVIAAGGSTSRGSGGP